MKVADSRYRDQLAALQGKQKYHSPTSGKIRSQVITRDDAAIAVSPDSIQMLGPELADDAERLRSAVTRICQKENLLWQEESHVERLQGQLDSFHPDSLETAQGREKSHVKQYLRDILLAIDKVGEEKKRGTMCPENSKDYP